MILRRTTSFLTLLATLGLTGLAGAEAAAGPQLDGADAVIARGLAAAAAQPPEAEVDPEAEPAGASVEAYRRERDGLEPEERCRRWIRLLHAALAGQEDRWGNHEVDQIATAEVWALLPGPADWPHLVAVIGQRDQPAAGEASRELSLAMIASAFGGDPAGGWALLERFDDLLQGSENWERYRLQRSRNEVVDFLLGHATDPDEIRRSIAAQIAGGSEMMGELELPDLVTRLGEASAREVIELALTASEAPLAIARGDETIRVARVLATRHIDDLRAPQWGLAHGVEPEAMALYEALRGRWGDRLSDLEQVDAEGEPAEEPDAAAEAEEAPAPAAAGAMAALLKAFGGGAQEVVEDEDDEHDRYEHDRDRASVYYLVGLVLTGRPEEATQLALRLGSGEIEPWLMNQIWHALEDAGQREALYAFVTELLTAHPEIPLWDTYAKLAVRLGRGSEAVGRLREVLDGELDAAVRAPLERQLSSALLAADAVDEALPLLRAQLVREHEDADDGCALALRCLELSRVLGDAELAAAAETCFKRHLAELEDWSRNYQLVRYAQALRVGGDLAAAERLLIELLESELTPEADAEDDGWGMAMGFGDSAERTLLAQLVLVYHEAGRHGDVLALLERAPWWGTGDLAALLFGGHRYGAMGEVEEQELGTAVAAALIDAGRGDDARGLLHAILAQEPGYDPAYAQLLAVDAAAAEPFLRLLLRRDRFEERPLIWLARLQLEAGELDAAEASARQAIAIDPSDGEQPRGDRMRVYAVLADILAARGDDEQAGFFRGVVRAIRASEAADRLEAAGLVSRAVADYGAALGHFADAYCIQSRLAVQLAELGRFDEAAEHYRRAFELMPDSFGRMESHCFGCEGAFSGELAQAIAEEVFGRALEADPDKPQLHYLQAYLREIQGRFGEARAGYARAVELDPDYINAWQELGQLHDRIALDPDLRQEVVLNLARLDPLGRHVHLDVGAVLQLERLWNLIAGHEDLTIERPETLLPLTASAAALAAQREDDAEGMHAMVHDVSIPGMGDGDGWAPPTPAEVMRRHPLIDQAFELVD